MPVFVRMEPGSPQGNADLVAAGGRPLDGPALPDAATVVAEAVSPSRCKRNPGKRAAEQEVGYEQGTLDL